MAKTKNLLFVLLAALFLSALSTNGLKAQTPDEGSVPPQEVVKADKDALTQSDALNVKSEASHTAYSYNVKVYNQSQSVLNTFNTSGESQGKAVNLYTTENRKLIKSYSIKQGKFPI